MTQTDPIYTVVVIAVAITLAALTVAACVPPLWRATQRAAGRVIDRKVAAAQTAVDVVDQHFDTAVVERPWYEISPTCADLRAQWAEWEKELAR